MAEGERAKIEVIGDKDGENETLEVLFNPEKYTLDYHTSYQDTPISGTDQVVTQFMHGNPSTLNVELFFDTSKKEFVDETVESSDVTDEVNGFINLVYVKSSLHRPPRIKFQWGTLNYTGVVTNIGAEFIEFEESGKPVRATLKLVIKEYIDITKTSRETPFESPDRTKVRQLTDGKNLWHIAYEEYGTMNMWKTIARENNMRSPLKLVSGQYLKIPAL